MGQGAGHQNIYRRIKMVVKHEYFVGYQYVDADFRIKNSAMLSMFEDMAGMHGSLAGEDVRTADTVWILTSYKIDVKKRPEYGEYVTVCTWSRSIRGLLAFREFEIRSKDGELLVCALSEWAHISKADKRPARVTPELEAAYGSEPDHSNFAGARVRATREPAEYSNTCDFTVYRNWIDVNRHMNNVHYAELAEMAMPEDAAKSISELGFEIYYRKEIKYGETVRCHYAKTEDGHAVTVKSLDGETVHAQIKYIK